MRWLRELGLEMALRRLRELDRESSAGGPAVRSLPHVRKRGECAVEHDGDPAKRRKMRDSADENEVYEPHGHRDGTGRSGRHTSEADAPPQKKRRGVEEQRLCGVEDQSLAGVAAIVPVLKHRHCRCCGIHSSHPDRADPMYNQIFAINANAVLCIDCYNWRKKDPECVCVARLTPTQFGDYVMKDKELSLQRDCYVPQFAARRANGELKKIKDSEFKALDTPTDVLRKKKAKRRIFESKDKLQHYQEWCDAYYEKYGIVTTPEAVGEEVVNVAEDEGGEEYMVVVGTEVVRRRQSERGFEFTSEMDNSNDHLGDGATEALFHAHSKNMDANMDSEFGGGGVRGSARLAIGDGSDQPVQGSKRPLALMNAPRNAPQAGGSASLGIHHPSISGARPGPDGPPAAAPPPRPAMIIPGKARAGIGAGLAIPRGAVNFSGSRAGSVAGGRFPAMGNSMSGAGSVAGGSARPTRPNY